jgi:hypothetical protein
MDPKASAKRVGVHGSDGPNPSADAVDEDSPVYVRRDSKKKAGSMGANIYLAQSLRRCKCDYSFGVE